MIIAGPNGAGKTTFARKCLPNVVGLVHFINDMTRRFKRGWVNFLLVYKPLADGWTVYENSGTKPVLLERGP
jgi:predicted ABC-type ATPase